jgi:O-antigen/teichoic acid export membrane protein
MKMMTKLKIPKKLLRIIGSSSLLFFALSGLSSLLNYAIYPILSRLVSVDTYGEIQFLLSSFNQLAVGFVVLNILAVIITVTVVDKNSQKGKVRSLNIIAGVIALSLALIGIVALLANMSGLQLSSPMGIIFIGIALILNVPYTITVGQLQGSGKFVQSGVVGIVATLGKFVFSIIFVLAGLGVAGAMLGVALGMGISLLIGYFYSNRSPMISLTLQQHIKSLLDLKYIALTGLFCITVLTLLSTVDSIASRIILSTTEAGLYAAVATLAKIILAATAPLLWLTLPPAIQGDNKLVKRYILVTTIICTIIIASFSFNSQAFIQITMSINVERFAQLLPIAALSMSVYAIAFILTAILICKNKFKILNYSYIAAIVIFAIPIIVTVSRMGFINMLDVILCQIFAGLVIIVPLAVSLFRSINNKIS